MYPRTTRSISTPIILASVAVAAAVAMLVGWVVVVVRNMEITQQIAGNTWLLVAGIVSLVLIVTVLVLFSVFLVREIKEVRRQTSFIDSVTHELKSPLASLKLCLETMQRPELDDAQRRTLRNMMLSDVERLATFIDDVLEASRIAHGRRTHVLAEVSLAELARESAGAIAGRYDIPPDAIVVEVPEDLRIMTDRTAIETVLKNLIDNAVKYSDPPVHVSVRAEPAGRDQVRLEVRDRGIGISKHDLKRVFERFYRVPTDKVRARRGTGLGLFVVSALVRNLGGRLQARSEGVGQGTSMEIVLPIGSGDASAP